MRKAAKTALEGAGAMGTLPTPVDDIVAAANLEVASVDLHEPGLLDRIRSGAKDALKRAIEAVLGVFDVRASLIFLDGSLPKVKQRFLKLHETGHGTMPWQRDVYAAIEESSSTLSPDISDLFDREANVFASEVLFQLDSFDRAAADHAFSIKVPLTLGRKYGASAYAALRRYVAGSDRACAVLVLDALDSSQSPAVAALRRVVKSPAFAMRFGSIEFPDRVSFGVDLGRLIPRPSTRMSRPQSLTLKDANNATHECIAEGFSTPSNVFILLYPLKELNARGIVVI